MIRCPRFLVFLAFLPAPLLAAVNVRDFGAIPDDGKDDTIAIQTAIDRAGPGQTINFPPGEFDINGTIDPHGEGRTLQGSTKLVWRGEQLIAESQTILKATGNKVVFGFHGANLNLRNLSFDGRGIFCNLPDNVMVRGLVIDNCSFHLDVTGEDDDSIEFTTGLANSKITNCLFDPIKGDNGIYGYNWDNLTIANNHFKNGNEGVHLTAFVNESRDLLIEQNYFTGLHRMGVEIQGGGNNTIVQDNCYDNPVLSARPDDNGDTFAYSIVSDRSKGTRVRRNTSVALQRPDGIGVRIVFELGGQDVICEDNYSVGGNHVIAGNGARATGAARNNRIIGYLEEPRNSNDATLKFDNNGPSVPLTWDMSRGKPGPNRRYPSTQPTQTPPP